MKSVISLFDRVGGSYGQPMFAPSLGAGLRSIGDEVNRAADGNILHSHAEDFEVHILCEFDEFKGEFVYKQKNITTGEEEDIRRLVCRASDLRRRPGE